MEKLFYFWLIRFLISHQFRLFIVQVLISGVVKDRHRLIKFLVSDRIIGMAMALHTGHRGSLPYLESRSHTFEHCCHPELLIIGPSFVIGHGVSMESRGNKL